jgi:hypothetical protein
MRTDNHMLWMAGEHGWTRALLLLLPMLCWCCRQRAKMLQAPPADRPLTARRSTPDWT